jgi:N-acetylmuramate 1-kinase
MIQALVEKALSSRLKEPNFIWSLCLPDEEATDQLAAFLAEEIRAGDILTLQGDLGTGKTTFARTFIRHLARDPDLEVPSPTFTLMQEYDTPHGSVLHADLYRIENPSELEELGFDEISKDAVTLIEWPEKVGDGERFGLERVEISLALRPDAGEQVRLFHLRGYGSLGLRLAQAKAIRELVSESGWDNAMRILLQGDASSRAYERLTKPRGQTAILMISPPRPDGPVIRRGKSYSELVHLAESVHAFVAMARGLRALDFSAPDVYGQNLEIGLLLLEDLGNESVVDANGPIPNRYAEATQLLARLHATTLPHVLPVVEGIDHVLPPYDLDAFLIEADLLLDWYAPHIAKTHIPGSARIEFTTLWSEVLNETLAGPKTWVLRDFHSPNLMWVAHREGLARVGLLDFQDAVLGPPAYDLVSLLQDARVTVTADLELKLLGAYIRARRGTSPTFDMEHFARSYAVMGAQRATKILGIFARLDRRDNKPVYLKHVPRVEAYLARNLDHPSLARLRLWYETWLPHLCAS